MKTLIYILICTILVISTRVSAQQVISSGGTHAAGANVQLSWTIGEPVVSTLTGTNAILTQGFHQGKLTVTAIEPVAYPGISLLVYPNPVIENINIQLEGIKGESYGYSLVDINSREIMVGKIAANPQSVEMKSIATGTYLLKVFNNKGEKVQVFKVIIQ